MMMLSCKGKKNTLVLIRIWLPELKNFRTKSRVFFSYWDIIKWLSTSLTLSLCLFSCPLRTKAQYLIGKFSQLCQVKGYHCTVISIQHRAVELSSPEDAPCRGKTRVEYTFGCMACYYFHACAYIWRWASGPHPASNPGSFITELKLNIFHNI